MLSSSMSLVHPRRISQPSSGQQSIVSCSSTVSFPGLRMIRSGTPIFPSHEAVPPLRHGLVRYRSIEAARPRPSMTRQRVNYERPSEHAWFAAQRRAMLPSPSGQAPTGSQTEYRGSVAQTSPEVTHSLASQSIACQCVHAPAQVMRQLTAAGIPGAATEQAVGFGAAVSVMRDHTVTVRR